MRACIIAALVCLPLVGRAELPNVPLFELVADSDLIMTATLTNVQKQLEQDVFQCRGQLVPVSILHGMCPPAAAWLVWSVPGPGIMVKEDPIDFTRMENQTCLWLLKQNPDSTYSAGHNRVQQPEKAGKVLQTIQEHVHKDPRTHAPDGWLEGEVRRLMESVKLISLQRRGVVRSDSTLQPGERLANEVRGRLHALGKAVVPTLAENLGSPDVQMRRNAALMLIDLAAGGYGDSEKVRIDPAFDALVRATEDADADVRALSVLAIAEMDLKDDRIKAAVSILMRLVKDPEEGARNNACLALGRIGPVAKEALPVLRDALKDTSQDVRKFAQQAIDEIQPSYPVPAGLSAEAAGWYHQVMTNVKDLQINMSARGQSPNGETCYTVELKVGEPRGPYSTGSSEYNIGATMSRDQARQLIGFLVKQGWFAKFQDTSARNAETRDELTPAAGIWLSFHAVDSQYRAVIGLEQVLPWEPATITVLTGMQAAAEGPAGKVLGMFTESARKQHTVLISEGKVDTAGSMGAKAARALAERTAKAAGRDTSLYDTPLVRFDPETRKWTFFYGEHDGMAETGSAGADPGMWFTVIVDEATGKAAIE